MLNTLIGFLDDLLILILPTKAKSNKQMIAFIVHPRDNKDIYKKVPILRRMPRFFTRIFERYMWAVTVSNITKDGKIIGYMISTPSSAKTMLHDRMLAKRKIKQAIKLARKKGAKIATLGALTASLTAGGKDVYDGSIYITTGHVYTVVNINNILQKVINDFSLVKERVNLAIVGAAGSIGSGSARLAVQYGIKHFVLIDIERKLEKLNLLSDELYDAGAEDVIVTSDLSILKKDKFIVVAATNHPDALIKNEYVAPGTIIIDDAQPSDVEPSVFDRSDVLVLEGGATKTPGVINNFPLGLCEKDDNFSCLAEGLLLLYEDAMDKVNVGEINMENINYIKDLAAKYKFTPSKYQNYKESCIKFDKINNVKKFWNKI